MKMLHGIAVNACLQKEALAADYTASVQSYIAAVEDMERIGDSADVGTYQKLLGHAEVKRLTCEIARLAIRRHKREHHRCGGVIKTAPQTPPTRGEISD